MSISSTIKIDVEQGEFTEKVNLWMRNNYDKCENESEYEEDINALLQGYKTELGGLVAIRGFVYQYYVAIYYMLKMLHKRDAWWHSVVFELMDDITLLGENQVRFVQVKTVKEEGEVNNFTPAVLYKREKGEIGSWLDKLFLNFADFNSIYRDKFIGAEINDIVVEFEIATNNTYNKELNVYSDNAAFYISDNNKLSKLSTKLADPCKVSGSKLHDKVGKEVTWCLSRFRLHHMNSFMVLKDQIINIIKEISKQDSTDVSEHILNHIFYHVMERTHNDKVADVKQFVFTKDEVQQLIQRLRPAAVRDAREYLHKQDIQSKFIQCIDELRNDFKQIPSLVKIELLQTLTWIQDEFVKKSNHDVSVYVRFLHLLFDMTSSGSERSIKNSTELTALKKSLEMITLCLTFYVDRQFLLSDARMITKQGKNQHTDLKIFTLFHANESGYFDDICKKVNDVVDTCPILQRIHEQFYCLILGSKKRSSLRKRLGVTNITDDFQEPEKIEITDKPSLIKYYDPEFLDDVQDYFYSLDDELSLRNSETIDSWHDFLETKGNLMLRKGVI
ncbi:hypothetical protein FHS16_002523 [Paenibacillus endophyticus]|uniref:CD-NTase associated protein 4-like DNA endonuclease domain-containing protein n=1 Tax=Paenibacillus endophyticus TaxID=1294268 RepID=A0A7W5C7C0_9BACL|nr:dsDNA nuclease domain-containing protein [Paenibacillus endophyticus]MBB3152473.1 hypothetical protein [Paenibacillus endophyticus]